MPLAVARESSIRLIDRAVADNASVGVFTQRDASVEEPTESDLYPVGTLTHIHKMFKLADGSLRLIVQGLTRVSLDRIVEVHPFIVADVHAEDESVRDEDQLEVDALLRNIKNNFQQVVSLSPLLSDDLPVPGREHLGAWQAGGLHCVEPHDDTHLDQTGGA